MNTQETDTSPAGVPMTRRAVTSDAAHPSAPIPVQGAPLGAALRTTLGETGLRVFPLALGGAEFGWHVDSVAAHRILDVYAERGGNAVHTSDGYSSGRSEHIIGTWMAARRNRDDVVLSVRVGNHPDHSGLDSVSLVRSVEASLTRLQTDRIDVLYLDANGEVPVLEDALATAEWLVGSGKVRHLGVRGMPAAQLVEARILSAAGYPRITTLDAPYNLLRREEFEGDVRLVAGAQGIAVTASQALAHGFLAGPHRSRAAVGRSVRGAQLAAAMNRKGTRALRCLDRIAEELSISTAAVAIAWVLAQRGITAATVNPYAPGHVEELVQGVGARLGRAQLAEIARATQ